MTVGRKLTAEALGTMVLLAAIVGSGIMGDRLSSGNVAIALLANTIATGATLVAIILAIGNISGAHLNPAVTMSAAIEGCIGVMYRDMLPLSLSARSQEWPQRTACSGKPCLLFRNTRVRVCHRCLVNSLQRLGCCPLSGAACELGRKTSFHLQLEPT